MLCFIHNIIVTFIYKFQVTNKRTNMSTPKEIFLNHVEKEFTRCQKGEITPEELGSSTARAYDEHFKSSTTETVDPVTSEIFQDAEGITENYDYIVKDTSNPRNRVIEHPSPSNPLKDEYRFCCPENRRTRISNATFLELKDTLNKWQPDGVPCRYKDFEITTLDDHYLRKFIIKKENINDFRLIMAFELSSDTCHKAILYNVSDNKFHLRTSHTIIWAIKENYKSRDILSYDPEYCVDLSTLLASPKFWMKLKKIINSM